MKKIISVVKCFFIVIMLLNPLALFSQNWIKTYDTTTFIQSSVPLIDGGVLAIGHNKQNLLNPIGDSIFLLKIDKNGTLIKSKLWLVSQIPLAHQLEDSSFLFVLSSNSIGKPSKIVKFSSNLDSIWAKTITSNPNEYFKATKFKKLLNGNLGLTGNLYRTNWDSAFFFKLNVAGDILQSQKFGNFYSADGGIYDFIEENNGDLTLLTTGYQTGITNLLKINRNLEVLGVVNVDFNFVRQFYKTSDGNFLLSMSFIAKVKPDGTIIWVKSETSFNNLLRGAVPLKDGSFATISYGELINGRVYSRLFRLDIDGKIDSLCYIPSQIGSSSYGIQGYFYSDKNDKIIYYGLSQDTLNLKYRGFVAKTDLNCILSSTHESNHNNNNISIYPNPIRDEATIEIDSENISPYQHSFSLFDVWGRLIKIDNFIGEKYLFQRQNLANGLYIFQIKNEKRIIGNGKIILN